MVRKVFACLCAVFLVLCPGMEALAASGTPSDAECNGDYLSDCDDRVSMDDDSDIDWIGDDGNTVSDYTVFSDASASRIAYSNIYNTITRRDLITVYLFNEGWEYVATSPVTNVGHFSMVYSDRTFDWIRFVIPSKVLPPSGKYRMDFGFSSDLSGYSYSSFYINSVKTTPDAHPVEVGVSAWNNASDDGAGGFTIGSFYVDTSNLSLLYVAARVSGSRVAEMGGNIVVQFTPVSSIPPDTNWIGSPLTPSSTDIQSNISDAVSQVPGALTQMSGQLENIGNTLQEIVTTISNQLNALWNQMYNLMHVPHMAKLDECTTKIVDAINDIYIDFSSFSQQIISNDNKLYADKEAADNQRQNQLVNGYDNTTANTQNKQLEDNLTQYVDYEETLMGDVKDYINNFTFNNPFSSIVTPVAMCTQFLNTIYQNIGGFRDALSFSLTLTVALMCIGWYRFRGA